MSCIDDTAKKKIRILKSFKPWNNINNDFNNFNELEKGSGYKLEKIICIHVMHFSGKKKRRNFYVCTNCFMRYSLYNLQ